MIRQSINDELEKIDRVEKEARVFLKNAPDGSLRVVNGKNKPQFYCRKEVGDTTGKYIRNKDVSLAEKLAQKDYSKKVIKEIEAERKRIMSINLDGLSNTIEAVYDELTDTRKNLVRPYILPEDMYVKIWLENERANRKNILRKYDADMPEIFTENGEQVRSKSEKILADKFFIMNIPYVYEPNLHLNGYGNVSPDFKVLNKHNYKEYYWEHFGMMDDEDYCLKAIKKIELYQRNGFYPGKNLLITYETSIHPLNIRNAEMLINEFLV